MIDFSITGKNSVDIKEYSQDCSLGDLVNGLDLFLLKNGACRRCGTCCHDPIPLNGIELREIMGGKTGSPRPLIPKKPDVGKRIKSIKEISRTFEMPMDAATILHDFNNADPVCVPKTADGNCVHNAQSECSIYPDRPLICRLYHCRFRPRLSGLVDMIVAQGVWHSYLIMGWIGEKDISRNPFLGAGAYADIPLSAFDRGPGGPGGDAAYLL